MSIKKFGIISGALFAAAMATASGPATAQSLAWLGLDEVPDRCDLKMTRRVLANDVEAPGILGNMTDTFCDCQVVTQEMLEYLRRHELFEVVLGATSAQCQGFANVLTNVETASVNTPYSFRTPVGADWQRARRDRARQAAASEPETSPPPQEQTPDPVVDEDDDANQCGKEQGERFRRKSGERHGRDGEHQSHRKGGERKRHFWENGGSSET